MQTGTPGVRPLTVTFGSDVTDGPLVVPSCTQVNWSPFRASSVFQAKVALAPSGARTAETRTGGGTTVTAIESSPPGTAPGLCEGDVGASALTRMAAATPSTITAPAPAPIQASSRLRGSRAGGSALAAAAESAAAAVSAA